MTLICGCCVFHDNLSIFIKYSENSIISRKQVPERNKNAEKRQQLPIPVSDVVRTHTLRVTSQAL